MEEIRSLDEMVEHLKKSGIKKRVAVAFAQDQNTISSISEAVKANFVEAWMVGDKEQIIKKSLAEGVDPSLFNIIDICDETKATYEALRLVKEDKADILMKGLVGTDKFLRAVLDKEKGLMLPQAVMSYVCALQLPRYKKLLFVSDTAVLPQPDLKQKLAMINYTKLMCQKFGIKIPKIALIGASEKVNANSTTDSDYAMICKMADRGQIKDVIIDGTLDIFLACDPNATEIKGVPNKIEGDADALIFPSLETCNSFYKGLMLFGDGELGGLIQGTSKPVVVMSRSESAKSKLYCIALAVLTA